MQDVFTDFFVVDDAITVQEGGGFAGLSDLRSAHLRPAPSTRACSTLSQIA